MQTLVISLEEQGLSNDQIQTLFVTIHEWLEDYYPVIAKIAKPVMAQELGIKELSFSDYVVIEG